MAFRTAYAVPDRIGAVASYHGGNGLVTSNPDSPHLQAAATKAQFLVAIAQNDDMQSPTEKTVMKDTFAKAGLAAEVEVYAAMHGWCPPDFGRLQRAARREGGMGSPAGTCMARLWRNLFLIESPKCAITAFSAF